MTVDAVSTGYTPIADVIGASAKSAATTAAKTSNDELDKDSFLKLLVAQLKYQDPSKPMDSSAFMAQSAQFSQLEALQNLQKEQTQMLNATQSVAATNMLGQKIIAQAANGTADITGVVTGVRL